MKRRSNKSASKSSTEIIKSSVSLSSLKAFINWFRPLSINTWQPPSKNGKRDRWSLSSEAEKKIESASFGQAEIGFGILIPEVVLLSDIQRLTSNMSEMEVHIR